MSDIILPNGERYEATERPKAVIGRRLKPCDELVKMCGMQLWLRNPPEKRTFPIAPGGLVGIIVGPVGDPAYPKRANGVRCFSYFEPGAVAGVKVEELEVTDPWACPPGLPDQAVSLLE